MSSAPPDYATIGPIYIYIPVKDKFRSACKIENKTMETKVKEMVNSVVKEHFPEFIFPREVEET